MTEAYWTAVTAAIMAAIMNTVGLYAGATGIAIIAAFCRVSYSPEQPSLRLFGKFFGMSLGLTMLIVHIGLLREWDRQSVIIVSGVAAFLCREVLEAIMATKFTKLLALIGKLK